MKDLFSKCGFNCGHCPAYKENAKTKEARQRGSDGWKKYFGSKFKPDNVYCYSCQAPDDELRKKKVVIHAHLLNVCRIRRCAIKNGIETCAHCFRYPCDSIKQFGTSVKREEIASQIGVPIPEKDYLAFIEPYEGLKHLDKIRTSLNPEDIKEPIKLPPLKTKIADFPVNLPFSKKQTSVFKDLYRLLVTIKQAQLGLKDTDTYAQQVVLKKRRDYVLRLLWTFGLFGKLKKKGVSYLTIDSETYSAQKITGHWKTVNLHIKILKKYGVHCEHIPLPKEKQGKKGWLTPMGWLRKTGWFMRLSFNKKAGGISALKALKSYTSKLDKNYDKRAFRYFQNVDMRVLMKKGK